MRNIEFERAADRAARIRALHTDETVVPGEKVVPSDRYQYTFRQKLGFFGLLWMAWLVGYGFGAAAYA